MRISDWSSDVCSSDLDPGEEEDSSVPFDLPPPPPPGSGRFSMALPEDLGGRPLPEVKKELRDANADLAMDLVRFTGLSHREVNGRLNRLAGVTRITEARSEEHTSELQSQMSISNAVFRLKNNTLIIT